MEELLNQAAQTISQNPELAAGGAGALVLVIIASALAARRKKAAARTIGPNETLRRQKLEEARRAEELRKQFTVVKPEEEKATRGAAGSQESAQEARPRTGVEVPTQAPEHVTSVQTHTERIPGVHKQEPVPVERPKTIDEILANTRKSFWGRVSGLLTGATVDKDFVENLEEVLYSNDLGPRTVEKLLTRVQEHIDQDALKSPASVKKAIRDEVAQILDTAHARTMKGALNGKGTSSEVLAHKPHVILVVGVNGVGKTTSIGKIAYKFATEGKKVLVAAGDTFRAAAAEQLGVWTERAGVDIYSSERTKDPGAVAYEAVQKAHSDGYDVAIIDTAGRLHTKDNLMEELKKVKRVMDKAHAGSPHEILLVVDANTGQNALFQARQFHETLGLTGLVVTKLDGTAKGGVIVGIAFELGVGVKHIGVGEKLTDLRDFNPDEFVHGLFGEA